MPDNQEAYALKQVLREIYIPDRIILLSALFLLILHSPIGVPIKKNDSHFRLHVCSYPSTHSHISHSKNSFGSNFGVQGLFDILGITWWSFFCLNHCQVTWLLITFSSILSAYRRFASLVVSWYSALEQVSETVHSLGIRADAVHQSARTQAQSSHVQQQYQELREVLSEMDFKKPVSQADRVHNRVLWLSSSLKSEKCFWLPVQ